MYAQITSLGSHANIVLGFGGCSSPVKAPTQLQTTKGKHPIAVQCFGMLNIRKHYVVFELCQTRKEQNWNFHVQLFDFEQTSLNSGSIFYDKRVKAFICVLHISAVVTLLYILFGYYEQCPHWKILIIVIFAEFSQFLKSILLMINLHVLLFNSFKPYSTVITSSYK